MGLFALRNVALFLAVLNLNPLAFGEEITFKGSVFKKNSQRKKLLFYLQHKSEVVDGLYKSCLNIYTDLDGKEVLSESLDYYPDGSLKTLIFDQMQTQEKGKLEVKDGRVFFQWTKDGKTKTDDEKLSPNLVVAATLVPYLHKQWDRLLSGKEVDVRFAALDRNETVGFSFTKIAEKNVNGKEAIFIKMKASSFIISAIVDPLYFTFDKESKKIMELVGRTAPKIFVGGKWKDLDADIVYEHPTAKK